MESEAALICHEGRLNEDGHRMKDMLLRIAKTTHAPLTGIRILSYNLSGMTFFRIHSFITHTLLHVLGNRIILMVLDAPHGDAV